jgi:hypothetical protein
MIKRERVTLSKFLFSILVGFMNLKSLVAQVNLLQNGSFEGPFTPVSYVPPLPFDPSCPTFTNMAGCYATHGTPEIVTSTPADGLQYVRMWHTANDPAIGEGVALELTEETVDGYAYNLCFWYRAFNDPGGGTVPQGVISCALTNNAPSSPIDNCGDPIPAFNPVLQILVGTLPLTNVWTFVSIPFTADGSYNNLVIYPQDLIADNNLFSIHIDGVNFSMCEPSLQLHATNIPNPSGYYQRQNWIQAGSHLIGSTTIIPVIADPNVNTIFRAGKFVELTDDFLAAPNSGSYFLAELGDCVCTGNSSDSRQQRYSGLETVVEQGSGDIKSLTVTNAIKVYPNPTNDMITITSLPEEALLEIYTSDGKLVYSKIINGSNVNLSLKEMNKGIYLLKVTNKCGNYKTKQLIKSN